MLCKTQVARNLIEWAYSIQLHVASSELYRIDAKKWFNAAVDACWFKIEVNGDKPNDYTCSVFDNIGGEIVNRFGAIKGQLVSDVVRYKGVAAADGCSPYEWRSGLKHDAASVYELTADPEPITKFGNRVELEEEFLYPLLKSTDIYRGRHRCLSKWVIVPQKTFGCETTTLARTAPRLWKYLNANSKALDKRKSSIYRNRPRFSVFGHGEYTYAPYKVAISGLHKSVIFRLVTTIEDKPVVLDDTCYFLPFHDGTEAAVVTAVLNSEAGKALVESLVFWDSKRPITKKLLSRLDLNGLPIVPEEVIHDAAKIATASGTSFNEEEARRLIGNFGQRETINQGTLF
jgi:hypothetical protein